jgi:hypothetical protein
MKTFWAGLEPVKTLTKPVPSWEKSVVPSGRTAPAWTFADGRVRLRNLGGRAPARAAVARGRADDALLVREEEHQRRARLEDDAVADDRPAGDDGGGRATVDDLEVACDRLAVGDQLGAVREDDHGGVDDVLERVAGELRPGPCGGREDERSGD